MAGVGRGAGMRNPLGETHEPGIVGPRNPLGETHEPWTAAVTSLSEAHEGEGEGCMHAAPPTRAAARMLPRRPGGTRRAAGDAVYGSYTAGENGKGELAEA